MLKDAVSKVYIPTAKLLVNQLMDQAEKWAQCPMLAHTHGQPASPTTLGK